MRTTLDKVTIIGAGTMGHALALVFARCGAEVSLTDIDHSRLEQAKTLIRSSLENLEIEEGDKWDTQVVMDRIKTVPQWYDLVKQASLVIESITESVEAKRSLFSELAAWVGNGTVVTSNTSYLNVFPLAPETFQERFLITHFFNPPYLIPLVELVKGPSTKDEVVDLVKKWLTDAGMFPLLLKRFVPGFIVNRLQRAIGREALWMVDEGIIEPEELDRAVKASLGIRLPVLGVFARYDFAGLDMAVNALKAPPIHLVSEDRLSPTLLRLVEAGCLGVKSGKGFYDYRGRSLAETLKERDRKLLQVRKVLEQMGELGKALGS
jgi:3-hydroxybutyryl-CoA dehydrogenase